ncbi:hypothetical protein JZ751_025550 [Albula glossodonta]|uniref:Protocadherin-20 n=1 Tax=Albula glossodonta TaxID=121402 RepID=A0A8T2MU41_9TELE|nr:hypothetical protein JZ751_016955 [Albula glossodonta]KAG9338587.1 hypothetical protein JZ751_025550 [Albula glossodonta]
MSEQYVNLNNMTGELCTSASVIDREDLCREQPDGQDCSLSFDVFVLPRQYFQLVKVKIIIHDVNDNKPSFSSDMIQLSVPENARINSRFALEQSAIDPDTGVNGVQTYWLINDFGVFSLDVEESESGELAPVLIVTGPLDRETKSEYITNIIAEDGGTPPLLGTATLKIIITDVNDNCPQFTESHVNVTVFGNATKGAHLTRLHAFDADVGGNAQVRYAYSERVPGDTRALFHLDKITGLIKLTGKIDTITERLYRLTVLANGPGCIPAVSTVMVNIVKVAVGPPAVTPRYIAAEKDGVVSLKESEPPFSPIAFFTVENADRGQSMDCHIEGAGPFRFSPYKLFTNEYLLETTDSLDYEEKTDYELTVVVKNSHGFVMKTAVRVQVIDENDNAPEFRQSLVELFIEENNAPGSFLSRLQATDRDSGRRGEVTYLLGSDAPAVFALDRVTGVLTVAMALDREERERYKFTVRAADRGTPRKESVATIVLTVLDRNDNHPRFVNRDFTFFIPENFPGFGEIGALSVTDADSGRNGWVALSIVNGSNSFVIDGGKGSLRAKGPLDREKQGSYFLWIEAVDGGEPSLSAVAMVTVLLIDVNDNPPVVLFPQSNQSYMLVPPTTAPGTSVTEVYAVDKDSGMNAVIAYSIIERKGGEPESFEIDPDTGNITLRRPLSNRGLCVLLVKVSDHGQPQPLHSAVTVNLFINETASNETYIHGLLTREADIEVEELLLGRLTEQAPKNEAIPCKSALVALCTICLGLTLTVVSLIAYISCKKKQRKKKRLETQIQIKLSDSAQATGRKLAEISDMQHY